MNLPPSPAFPDALEMGGQHSHELFKEKAVAHIQLFIEAPRNRTVNSEKAAPTQTHKRNNVE
jgi:hypothetical protein